MMMKKFYFPPLLFLLSISGFSTTFNVATSLELTDALAAATAGDVISVAPGTYTTNKREALYQTRDNQNHIRPYYFGGFGEGTAADRIVIKSADPSNPAILQGGGDEQSEDPSGYVLYITGDYWQVEDLIVEQGAKGVILDNSNHSIIRNVEVRFIGQEAIHVRDGSNNILIDGVNVHDIGIWNDGFGEGIYVGSDNSVWYEGELNEGTGENGYLYKRVCNDNIIINSTIGPNITAEPFDIKEACEGTIIENCTIYGSGVSGENFADSFIDIKANKTVVRCNTFIQEGNTTIDWGIMIVDRSNSGVATELTANDNYIHDNTFDLDETDIKMVQANSRTEGTYAWDNVNLLANGDDYNGRVIESIPSDYTDQCGTILSNQTSQLNKVENITTIFPNPIIKGEVLNIQINGNLNSQAFLLDITGNVIREFQLNSASMEIPTDYFHTGVSYLKIGNETHKIIVNGN